MWVGVVLSAWGHGLENFLGLEHREELAANAEDCLHAQESVTWF